MHLVTLTAYIEKEVTFEVEVESCPFCKRPILDLRGSNSFQVFCRVCAARGPLASTVTLAVQKWNEYKKDNPPPSEAEKED